MYIFIYVYMYLLAIAGQSAGPNRLKFVKETYGYFWGNINYKINIFFLNSYNFFCKIRFLKTRGQPREL